MSYSIIIIVVAIVIALRVILRQVVSRRRVGGASSTSQPAIDTKQTASKPPLPHWQQQLRTVLVLTKLSTKRFFRDRLAQFFAILFPLIFLFVFGSLTKNSGNVTFKVAVINESHSAFARTFEGEIKSSGLFKINNSITTLASAEASMAKNQLDGAIIVPPNFGNVEPGQTHPSGQVKVAYDESNASTGQTLTTVLQSSLQQLNARYVSVQQPFVAVGDQLNTQRLSSDYTFSGLLGFSIIGIGIFGPVNVFPELKKQGILRRLHTTPLRVWQYFLATMLGQAATGIIAIAIQFAVAITVFKLKVDGNFIEIALYTILSIFMILGLGLAIGGWARNERQAAPLANIIVFPMLFLSGTFFPRYLMPQWLQSVTNYLPLTPVIDGLRLLTTEGKSLLQIGPQLGLVAIWFVIIYAVAFRVFKWE
jgi:ABC-2 type transport system permease protein